MVNRMEEWQDFCICFLRFLRQVCYEALLNVTTKGKKEIFCRQFPGGFPDAFGFSASADGHRIKPQTKKTVRMNIHCANYVGVSWQCR